MTCPTCAVLKLLEECSNDEAIEAYAALMTANFPPPWRRINAVLAWRFGDTGLTEIQRNAAQQFRQFKSERLLV